MKNNKRAFTIVELVIVIAVIAILAAVLIPTFSSLIERANINSDTAAVKQMNTYLSADEQINGKPARWEDAVKILSKSGLDANSYKALSADHQIVYDTAVNRVLYVIKSTQEVIYPEEYAKGGELELGYALETRKTLEGQAVADDSWRYNVSTDFSEYSNAKVGSDGSLTSFKTKDNVELSGDALTTYINTKTESGELKSYYGSDNAAANLTAMQFRDDKTKTSDLATFTVKNAKGENVSVTFSKISTIGQLVSFKTYVQDKGVDGSNYTLFLSTDIDMQHAQWEPLELYKGNIDGTYINELTGKAESRTIANFNMSDRTAEVKMYDATTAGGSYFYYGFISVFEGNYLGNIRFEGAEVTTPGLTANAPGNFKKTGHVTSILCGLVNNIDNEDVVIENIYVGTGTVTGISRIGGVIGMLGCHANGEMTGGSITLRNITNNANVITESSINGAHSTAGGIASCTYRIKGGNVIFDNCVNNGDITGVISGGMFSTSYGKPENLVFINCKNTGDITAKQNNKTFSKPDIIDDNFGTLCQAGGFVGNNQGLSKVSLIDCTNEGNLYITNTYTTANAQTTCSTTTYRASGFICEASKCTLTMSGCTSNAALGYNVTYASIVQFVPLATEVLGFGLAGKNASNTQTSATLKEYERGTNTFVDSLVGAEYTQKANSYTIKGLTEAGLFATAKVTEVNTTTYTKQK